MRKSIGIFIFNLLFLVAFSLHINAQSLPVGTLALDDAYRRAQLLGRIDSSISFTSFPLFPSTSFKEKEKFDSNWKAKDVLININEKKGFVKLLPITWLQQYDSHHPESVNDGAMIPARGYQTIFSAGLYAQFGPLSIQLKPEIVFAQNKSYQGFPEKRVDKVWTDQLWYEMYNYNFNKIDLPERFGETNYKRIFWGQSSIRLTYGAISFGLSTENLWWGPGLQNSLVLSNTAPGFSHFTINTVKPIRTPIGSFEGQIIAGRLNNSGFFPPDTSRTYNGGPHLYEPKIDDWRYINGLIISYQPKWVPGFFIGATRSFQIYEKDMGSSLGAFNISDILPIFTSLSQKTDKEAVLNARKRDQHMSLFMRWVWLEGHGEVYAEYGRQSYFWDNQDLQVEPSFSGAYILGFRKLIPLTRRKDEYIQVNMELTQLAMNPATSNRKGQSWYLNDQVRAGYTNQGQLLGSGIGPGSNVQMLNVSWVKGIKQLGIQFERKVHNNDFQYTYIKDIRNHWVDLSATLHGEWNYKNLIFTAKIGLVDAMNYEWLYYPPPLPDFWTTGEDDFNFHGQLGLMYRF
ncbi:MAG: hypothetical protein HXX14_13240 [Bacteroidetes bacterium]|nr:hypothetical protein [Bacteroidota bacterium]